VSGLCTKEVMVLYLNEKKRGKKKNDFIEAINKSNIYTKAIKNMFNKFKVSFDNWDKFIDISFLPDNVKTGYHDLINRRVSQIYEPVI